MKKKTYAFLLATLLLCGGCSRGMKSTPEATPSPVPQKTEMGSPLRKDITGKIILERAARGVVKRVGDAEIVITENENERTFTLSDNAKTDAAVLEITEGVSVIVNYNEEANGQAIAVSLEKLVG